MKLITHVHLQAIMSNDAEAAPSRETIYLDESGHTGYDLLNPQQPFFSVASAKVSNSLAEEILSTSFPNYRGSEFKFTRLWANDRQKRNFVKFAAAVGEHHRHLFTYFCDKKFTLLTKAVDTLVEPIVHLADMDFYASNFNRGYVNMLHFGLKTFAGSNFYDEVVGAYAKFSRNPSDATLSELSWKYSLMAASCPEEVKPFMEMLSMGAQLYSEANNLHLQKSSNDIQFTCVLASVHYWRAQCGSDFEVVHDKSSNFFRKIDWWKQITSPDLPIATVPIANQQVMQFPLRVLSTRAEDSESSRALQLCDVIAGLLSRLLHEDHPSLDPAFRTEVVRAGFGEMISDGIKPDEEFIQGPIQSRSGPDMVDQFLAAVRRR